MIKTPSLIQYLVTYQVTVTAGTVEEVALYTLVHGGGRVGEDVLTLLTLQVTKHPGEQSGGKHTYITIYIVRANTPE